MQVHFVDINAKIVSNKAEMESCSQDVKLIKEALKRRKELLYRQDVPAQHELYNSQGDALGEIILNGMSPMAKFLMQADRVHNPPIFKLWISPESRIKKKICITEASHVEKIQALTHEGVIEMGATIEKKYEKKFLNTLKKAIEETSEYERFECEKRLKYALNVQKEIFMKKLNEIEGKLREEFDRERLEMQALYDSKYGEIISEVIKNTNDKYQKIIDDLTTNCTCRQSEIAISSTSVSTVSSLKASSGSTPSLEPDAKGSDNKNEGSTMYAAKKLWNDFEHHLRTQRNILQCSNTCDLVHFICTEKLESQKRVEKVQKEACEKIELLKKYLFDICCKVRNIECQCKEENEVSIPKCVGLKYCRCKHQNICISNDKSSLGKLICSCCGKEVDTKTCGGKDPMEGKSKATCKCPVKSTKGKGKCTDALDAKLSCFCGKEEEIKNEKKPEKQLCHVCRAKQICTIVAKMKWPQPPKPPCVCPERKFDSSIPCQCQHANNVKLGKSENQDLVAAAVVIPEYIGEQIYCMCQPSSSEDECTCLEKEDPLAKNKTLVNISWKQVGDNECIQLQEYNKEQASTESSSGIISKLEEEEKKSFVPSVSTASTPSQLPAKELKKKLIQDFDAAKLVDCVFSLSTPENLENPDYIKRRLEEEIKSKIEEIFKREEPKKTTTTESYSQGSTSATSASQERFIDHLLEIDKKKEEMNVWNEDVQLIKPKPTTTECKLDETSRDTWKNYVRLPKYMVPMASLFEGGWCYTQTTDEDWKIITKLIEENKIKEENCFSNKNN